MFLRQIQRIIRCTDSSSRHESFDSATVIARYSLRLVALFVMCCAILVHLSATNEIRSEQSQREQIVDRVFDDGEKRTLLHRQRKSAKNNVMVSLSEVQKRNFFFFDLSDR